ncbi:helix-turn-helix transcriptional regulator [Nonomuraea bangladeshensis]|uniref:helix-turn-helix transcriptional regulator n=1 Tax=Nonomuraea bangladeshensis TaxID=404385 RepID=UPI0031D29970
MIELRSADVPAAERFGWWCDLTARQLIPTEISSDHTADFHASVSLLPLGAALVASPRCDGMRSTRTARLVRRSDPELWMLTLVRTGTMWLEQGRDHISVRYLHHIFRQEEQTIGGYIRGQRLERCRADLTDGRHAGRSVTEIAARWGFADAAAFNRAFRSAYGMPPGVYRRHAATGST